MPKDVSVGTAAEIFGVATRTASKWVDDGIFKDAYRLPTLKGGKPGPRRIPPQGIIDLMYTMKLPSDRISAAAVRLDLPDPTKPARPAGKT